MTVGTCGGSFDLLTNEMAAAIDRATIEGGIPGIELMENAGRGIVRELLRRHCPRRCVVLCGPGNNGGDGYVVARRLAEIGIAVETAAIAPRERLANDAALASRAWTGPHRGIDEIAIRAEDIVIDALFGSGLTRAFDGKGADALKRAQAAGATIVSVDVPSGVNGSTGAVHGWAPTADLTVTFNRLKLGHALQPGRSHCGDIACVDIGIPEERQCHDGSLPRINHPSFWRGLLPGSRAVHHKYDRGQLAVLGGPAGMTGASILAAQAGEAAGAGLTTLLCDPAAAGIYASHLVTVMVRSLDTPEILSGFLQDRRIRATVAGPGMGLLPASADKLETVLGLGLPGVFDADALTMFAAERDRFFPLLYPACILTPHEGEMARLAPGSGPKPMRALALARQAGCVVLLKGSDTIIAAPDGRVLVNVNAPATLARAGSGDTLAGLIGGLLAGSMPGFEAAAAAAWLHAETALKAGPFPSVSALAQEIPSVLAEVRRSDVSR
ncbi:MAG: NAD(P)H-hydrate dehydratase [Geminicoccaceae bacterium]